MNYQSPTEVLKAAKKAFKDIEKTPYEKSKFYKPKPRKKLVGFIDGMKYITVYR